METDTSDGVVAGVLSQRSGSEDDWHTVAFLFKTMSPEEMNYYIYDKEMLAVIKAFR